MIIYRAYDKENKCYIGQTIKTLDERKIIHYKSNDTLLFHNKLKNNNFDWEILEECNSKEELNEKEKHYIKLYNSFGEGGYNLTEGGVGIDFKIYKRKTTNKGIKHRVKRSQDAIDKQREKMIGRKQSEETKEKRRKSMIGKNVGKPGHIKSDEERLKLSNSLKGLKKPERTEEHKKKISDNAKNKIKIRNEKGQFQKNKLITNE